jgi:hypothetical protein
MRVLVAILLLAALAWAGNFRLYLADGTWHMVREYQKLEDRVRYYSTERSDWEELPLSLVDLKKTEAERTSRLEAEKKQAAADDEEEKFERAVKREIARVPVDPGVYFVEGAEMKTIPRATLKSMTDKKRNILKVIVPVPLVAGKASLELPGENAAVTVPDTRPNLYFRIDSTQRFTIVRMRPKKGVRVVAILQVEPMSKMAFFDMDRIDVFRQQLQEDLYKVWPTKPLTPGEYALVQYSEGEAADTGEILAWDFRVWDAPPKN